MRLPMWMRSIRFRLALTYSILLFGLAAVVIGGVNLALARSLDDYPVSQRSEFRLFQLPDGSVIGVEQRVIDRFALIEAEANTRALGTLRRVSLFALLGLFPASVVIGYLVADRTLRPIERISAFARDIQASDLSQRIQLEGPDDELKHLADTFDEMLDRVESGIEAQRRFIQDASHELRNPLAVMATNLDVALADEHADAASLRDTAQVVRRTVDRTVQTVEDLVLFARNEVPASNRSRVELGMLADEVVSEFQGPIEAAGLRPLRVSDGGAVVDVDRNAVKKAFGNLVDNAVRITRPGTTLRYGAGRTGAWAWIGIADEGPGLEPVEHELAFHRGWTKGDPKGGRSRTGLGLAIVRQVAESHGGLATVDSTPGQGARFVIWLPAGSGASRREVSTDRIHAVHDPLGGS